MTLAQSLVLYFGALVVLCVVLCAAEDISAWFDRDDSNYPRGWKRCQQRRQRRR